MTPRGALADNPLTTDMVSTTRRLDLQSVFRLAELADYVISFSIRAVSDLGIADQLVDGPRAVEELAAATGAHAPSLHRVLRALASKGIFTEVEPGRFGLTPLAEPLRSDHPMSLRDALPLLAADVQAWARFDHSLRTGEPAFDLVHGRGLWEYLAAHPDESARFDRGMAAMTRPELRATLPVYEWGSLRRVVDVGGGNGTFLAGLLSRFPSMRGVLFDRPHVVAGAPEVLRSAGVEDRCEVVPGDFFDAVPHGGDAYLLKRILYSWGDDDAAAILRTVRVALGSEGRVVILEPVILPGGSQLAKLADVMMLATDGGHARTPPELEALFARAGLRLCRVLPTFMFSIVEARLADPGAHSA